MNSYFIYRLNTEAIDESSFVRGTICKSMTCNMIFKILVLIESINNTKQIINISIRHFNLATNEDNISLHLGALN